MTTHELICTLGRPIVNCYDIVWQPYDSLMVAVVIVMHDIT